MSRRCPGCKHAVHGPKCEEPSVYGNTSGAQGAAAACACEHDDTVRYREITEDEAREVLKAGGRVYGAAFDPTEIEVFDKNGFQVWARPGYRFEAMRYFAEEAKEK